MTDGPDMDAMIAALLTETSLTLPDLAELTDRQIFTLYYHPRDREGRVVSRGGTTCYPGEDEPCTEEEAARIHFSLGSSLGVPLEELKRTWLEKHDWLPEGI